MRLRTKLFLSVGAILLTVAILSYLLPELLVRKDLDKATRYLNEHIENTEKQLLQVTSYLITYRIVESAAELEGASAMLEVSSQVKSLKDKPWNFAAKIASYDPKIAFVEVRKQESSYVVIPANATLYIPLWKRISNGNLLIKITHQDQVYRATPIDSHTGYFLLSKIEPTPKESVFTPFTSAQKSDSSTDSTKNLYLSLLSQESSWIEKMELIQKLADLKSTDSSQTIEGILKVDKAFEHGVCILSKEVFEDSPLIGNQAFDTAISLPFLMKRDHLKNQDLDMVNAFTLEDGQQIAIAFSISSEVKRIASLIKKPILIGNKEELVLGISPSGNAFNSNEVTFSQDGKKAFWNDAPYFVHKIPIQDLSLIILTSEEDATRLDRFLARLKNSLVTKISLNLMGTAFILLGLALLVLEKISKKITEPISELALASEELSKGNYEAVKLPATDHRQDEVTILTHSFENLVVALKDREKIRGVLNKVVSKEIANEILKSNIELGGEERVATVLFSDIRGFTHFSEHMEPKALIALLNDYMTRMCRIIDETKGVVDKFVGDEIMALYGAPLAIEKPAYKAVEAAIKMMEHLHVWNEERKQKGELTFEIGIGIHTGKMLSGNMGAENRLNYTVVGANVNLASRLCTKALPAQILASEETKQAAGEGPFTFTPLPPVMLKGIDTPVPIYEVKPQSL